MKNNEAAKGGARRPVAKKLKSKETNLIVRIGNRDFNYDQVRTRTLHAPSIDVPVDQLTIFKTCMKDEQPVMDTNPIDDGNIRIVRVRPELYEVISGRNQIAAIIYKFKQIANEAGEKPENLNKTLDQLGIKIPVIKARLASWKHLNTCEHFGNKLSPEELQAAIVAKASDATIKVHLPKPERTVPVAALLQSPSANAKAPSSGKFGRIFSAAA